METNQLEVDPLEYFSRVCDDIRQNMDQQVQLKSSDAELDDGMMNNLRMQGSFSFLTLKQLNRLAQIRCKNIKDSTSEAKQKLDGYYLTLQNLQYEIGHLHREITKCLEFRSRHDSIPLVEVEKFYADAPSDISKPDMTREDEHAQTLARLDWELEQRKRLAEKVSELEEGKEQALNKIEKKKQDFQMLAPCLENLLKASLPLQEAFDLPLEKTKTEQELANILPRPLFVLFLQAKAYQEACDPSVEVSIEGDVQAATKLQQTDDKRALVVFNNQQSDDDSDSEQEDVDDQDSERIRKKHKKSSKKSKYENEPKKSGNENTKLHPLHVVISLNNLFEGSRLELKFVYYIKLAFASVKAILTVPDGKYSNEFMLENDGLLHCMLSEDYGDEIPNPGANHLVGSWTVSSNVEVAGFPYMWVQRMCGLDFISPNHHVGEDMKMSFKHVGNSFQLLRKRVASRLLLIKQLVQFDENLISCNSLTNSTNETESSLDKWSQLSWADYRKLTQNSEVLELGLCGEESEKGNPHKRHAYFEATFKRNAADGNRLATFKVAVALFPDYPRRLPLVTGRIELGGNMKLACNDYNLRAMEEMINIELPKKIADKNEILSAQLLRFSELFDIYVETSVNEGETEFGLNTIFSSKCTNYAPIRHQGPARLKPFNVNSKESAYRQ